MFSSFYKFFFEMDAQETFFLDQIQIIHQAIVAKEDEFAESQQAKREVISANGDSCTKEGGNNMLQAQPSNSLEAYKGRFDAFCITFQLEGFRGFYKGLLPNLLKVVPAASITYMVYERIKKNLDLE